MFFLVDPSKYVLGKEEKESSYEYVTMDWLLGNLVSSEGSYEIKLSSCCNEIDGAPGKLICPMYQLWRE